MSERHLATRYWYRISHDYQIVEYRATFYETCVKWVDHPWGQFDSGSPGADFENHWAVEQRYGPDKEFSPLGRSADGWDSLEGDDSFETREEAEAEALERVKNKIVYLEESAQQLRKRFNLTVGDPCDGFAS